MTTIPARRQFFRDAAAATAGVVGPYGLSVGVQFAPVQVPGYLLVVGFDAIWRLVGPFARCPLAFWTYPVPLGGAVATTARRAGRVRDGWRGSAASAPAVVGLGSPLFGPWTLAWADEPTPFAITGATASSASPRPGGWWARSTVTAATDGSQRALPTEGSEKAVANGASRTFSAPPRRRAPSPPSG